jgi:hypothetical protein
MVHGVNVLAVAAIVLCGLIDVRYVRVASEPSQLGPTPIMVLFLATATLACAAGARLPSKALRSFVLMVPGVTGFALVLVTFSIGVGLMLAALVAAAEMVWELMNQPAGVDPVAAGIGAMLDNGLVLLGWSWVLARSTPRRPTMAQGGPTPQPSCGMLAGLRSLTRRKWRL